MKTTSFTKSTEKGNDFFVQSIFFFKICAIWRMDLEIYFPKQLRGFAIILEILYRGFIIINSMFLFFVTFIEIIIRAESEPFINIAGNILNTAIIFWNVFCVTFFFMIREEKYKNLLALINSNFRKRSAPGLTFIEMKKSLNIGEKIIKNYEITCVLIVCSFMCLPFISGKRILPFGGIYPYDSLVSLNNFC